MPRGTALWVTGSRPGGKFDAVLDKNIDALDEEAVSNFREQEELYEQRVRPPGEDFGWHPQRD